MAVIANGGKLVTPRIVRSITTAEGETVSEFTPSVLRQVISPQTAQQISEALQGVVSEKGTAKAAAVAGFTVAGKTGTAQKVDPNGGYTPGKYVVSFSGYMPADRPEIVGLVMLDDAKTGSELNYGGTVAAPIFSRIAEKAAQYLNLEPQEEPSKPATTGKVALTTKPSRR
jgi:cell division protein FtsI/penicillin-binding protein 2